MKGPRDEYLPFLLVHGVFDGQRPHEGYAELALAVLQILVRLAELGAAEIEAAGGAEQRVRRHGEHRAQKAHAQAVLDHAQHVLDGGEAQRQGIVVRVAKLPIDAVLRSRTISETRGFAKALVEAGGDRILGFTMIGAEAGEVMAVVQTAMLAGMPYTGLRDAIIAHPTMAEGLGALFLNVPAL